MTRLLSVSKTSSGGRHAPLALDVNAGTVRNERAKDLFHLPLQAIGIPLHSPANKYDHLLFLPGAASQIGKHLLLLAFLTVNRWMQGHKIDAV